MPQPIAMEDHRRELPARALHASELTDGLADWLGTPAFANRLLEALNRRGSAERDLVRHHSDPRAASHLVRLERLERACRAAHQHAEELLTEAIAHGLGALQGSYLRDLHGAVYLRLRALGGQDPPGAAVCEGCGVVFRPRRRHAAKCDRCHAKPRTPALAVERDETSFTFHTPLGAVRRHTCAACGVYFNPKLPTARTCSGRCKTALSRGRELPEKAERERIRARSREFAAVLFACWPAQPPTDWPSYGTGQFHDLDELDDITDDGEVW